MSNNVLANVVSSNKKTHILLLSFSFFLFIYQILFAEQFPSESDVNFSLKLEIVVDKFSSRLLKNESKEVIAVVDIFNSKEEFKIAIAPEGTRDAVKHLKTGFYFIAKGANIPILLCRFDWGNKVISFSEPFYPTNEQEADFEYIENHFRGVLGYHHTKSFI